jgi:imidazolonepropionase
VSPAIVIRNARVLTMGSGPAPRRGQAMRQLGVIDRADVLMSDGVIRAVTPTGSGLRIEAEPQEIDAAGRVLMPGFVDCHSHLCWGGSRVDEWERQLAGETYQQILAGGGGIMSTVRATRESSAGALACDLLGRIDQAVGTGTTTVEVKTGYGLSAEGELKMLEAIQKARQYAVADIAPTLLLGHAIDPAFARASDFVDETIARTLPSASAEATRLTGLSAEMIAIDVFCERSAWSVEQATRLLAAGGDLGHPTRVHADQFTSMGMIGRAVSLNARSVDHLEATTADDARLLGASETFGVILPCCGFHVDGRYANGRMLVDAGVKLALATNANPGSAPCPSMLMAIALGVRFGKLTVSEALVAATVNAAGVLGLRDRGFIAPGARADLILLREHDERAVAYEFGSNPVEMTIINGKLVSN